MNPFIRTSLRIALFFAVGLIILYMVYNKQQSNYLLECELNGIAVEDCSLSKKIWKDITLANKGVLFIILVLFMISNISRALRWHLLLEPIAHKPRLINSVGSIMAAYLTNLGIPRSGELVRAGLLSRYEKIPVQKVLGTIFVDRSIDVLSLFLAVLLAFVLSFNTMYSYFIENLNITAEPGLSLWSWFWILILIISGITGLIILFKKRQWGMHTVAGRKIRNLISGFLDGIKSIRKVKHPGLFIFHSINIWFMYYLMTYLAFFALEATSDLSPLAGLLTFVFGAIGVLFPTPGGMGTYQYFVSEALVIYGINATDAFSFANMLFFAVQLLCTVFFGLLAFLLLPVYNRNRI